MHRKQEVDFGNRALGDTIYRVGRDLPRKLALQDRFVGALRLMQETDGDCTAIYRSIAAALRFNAMDESGSIFPADSAFHKRLRSQGVASVLQAHCGLSPSECRSIVS